MTLGSSVPPWPVFSTLSILLTHASISWDVGPIVLSRFTTPLEMCSAIGRLSGLYPKYGSVSPSAFMRSSVIK